MPVLPKLYWRIGATPQRPATTAAADVIATLKSQIINSCSFWQLVETPNTGSTSLLIKPIGAPTANSSAFSSSSNMNVVIAYNVTGSTAYRSPDTAASAQFRLQVGLTPDVTQNGSGSFSGPNRDRPFQTATGNPRWSGYWHCVNTGSVSASFIIESLDSIFIGFKGTGAASGVFGAVVGAIAESFGSSSGENDRRLYGMMTAGSIAINATFWNLPSQFAGNNNADGNAHSGVFIVSGGSPNVDATAGISTNVWQYTFSHGRYPGGYDEFATWKGNPAGSRQVAVPVNIYGATANNALPFSQVGLLRGMYVSSDDAGGLLKFQSGGIDQAYKVCATHNQTVNDAIIFGPASGSGL